MYQILPSEVSLRFDRAIVKAKAKYSNSSNALSNTLSNILSNTSSAMQQSNIAPTTSTSARLITLPPHILQRVIGFVFCGHDPDEVIGPSRTCQALLCLAATCRHTREHVEAFAMLTLTQIGEHTTHVNMEQKALQLITSPELLGYTTTLFHFKDGFCVFCGRSCLRQSGMMSTMRTCRGCEKSEWGIITRSDAKVCFDLRDAQLRPQGPTTLPRVRRGSDGSKGFHQPATIYLYSDVVKLATAVHGDWQRHMAEKTAKLKARKEAQAEKRRRGKAEAARTIPLLQQRELARQPSVELEDGFDHDYFDSPAGVPKVDWQHEIDAAAFGDNFRFEFNFYNGGMGQANHGADNGTFERNPSGMDSLAQAALGDRDGSANVPYDFHYGSALAAPGSNNDQLDSRAVNVPTPWCLRGRPASQMSAPDPPVRDNRVFNTFLNSEETMDVSNIDPALRHFSSRPSVPHNNTTQVAPGRPNMPYYFNSIPNAAADQNNFGCGPRYSSNTSCQYGHTMPDFGPPPLPPRYPSYPVDEP